MRLHAKAKHDILIFMFSLSLSMCSPPPCSLDFVDARSSKGSVALRAIIMRGVRDCRGRPRVGATNAVAKATAKIKINPDLPEFMGMVGCAAERWMLYLS